MNLIQEIGHIWGELWVRDRTLYWVYTLGVGVFSAGLLISFVQYTVTGNLWYIVYQIFIYIMMRLVSREAKRILGEKV